MEHNDAVRLQAVEKYILGDLSPAVRDEFEAHYFDCAVCSFNLRAGVAFAAGTRQFFAEAPAPARARRGSTPGWLAWLRPVIAAPVMAALLLVIGYQHFAQGNQPSSEIPAWYSLNDSSVRGAAGSRVEVQQGHNFRLMFDVPNAPQNVDITLRVEVRDSAGKILLKRIVTSRVAQKGVILDIPDNFKAGDYKVVVFNETAGSATPIQELPFTVAFSS